MELPRPSQPSGVVVAAAAGGSIQMLPGIKAFALIPADSIHAVKAVAGRRSGQDLVAVQFAGRIE